MLATDSKFFQLKCQGETSMWSHHKWLFGLLECLVLIGLKLPMSRLACLLRSRGGMSEYQLEAEGVLFDHGFKLGEALLLCTLHPQLRCRGRGLSFHFSLSCTFSSTSGWVGTGPEIV